MAEGISTPGLPDRSTEWSKIKELMDHPLNDGETWYLVDVTWFNQWKKFVAWNQGDSNQAGDPNCNPGHIDSSALLKDGTNELKDHLTEDIDFVLVPKEAWQLLVQWYSLVPGQDPIERKVVDHGLQTSYLRVEIYLTELRLAKYPDVQEQATQTRKFSKRDTLETVEAALREIFSIPQTSSIMLWARSNNQTYEELPSKKQTTIQELSLMSNQTVVAEVQNADSSWPRKPPVSSFSKKSLSVSFGDSNSSSSRSVKPRIHHSTTENDVVLLRYEWKYQPESVDVRKCRKSQLFSAHLAHNASHPSSSNLMLLINLEILGMKAEEVYCISNDPNDEPNISTTMRKVADDGESSTAIQMFDFTVNALNFSTYSQTFVFNILATSCVVDYQPKLMDSLLKSQLWSNREQQQSDVVLIVNGRPYPCHKAILAARSSVFLDKFIKDPNLTKVDITVDPLTTDADVKQFLEFVYTGQFTKPLISKQLSLLAKTFEIKTLIELCDCTQKEMTMVDLKNFVVLIEPYLSDYDPTVESRSDDVDVPLVPEMSLYLQLSGSADLPSAVKVLNSTGKQSVTLASFQYRDQPMFHSELSKFQGKYYIVFTAIEVGKIGFKIDQVSYSKTRCGRKRIEMTEKRSPFVEHIQIFKDCFYHLIKSMNITFHVKLSSSSVNFTYQLVNEKRTQQLWASAQNKQLTDVEFLVGGKSFAAHRFIISSRSPVFAAMFSTDMTEANTGTVTINDTDPGVFETFLKFLYTGTLEPFTLASDKRLGALADKYQVETLVSICQSSPELSKDDCIGFIMCS